ncbi:MAG: nuclear transport factor 2 family protein [Pseudomonadota bacterium]
MRILLLAAALLAPFPALAQSKASDKLPPANPLPYQDNDAAAVLTPINALFAALEGGDAAEMLRHVKPEGRLTSVGDTDSGRFLSWTEFAARVTPERAFQERIANPAIEVDGNVAMVWAPYVVRVAGKVSNCGIDHFDLVRENGNWKILNLTFSTRTTGCPAK